MTPDYVENGENDSCLFIDYKGKMVKSVEVNGTVIAGDVPNVFLNHKVYVPSNTQVVGKNRVIIEFESSYVTNCEGF